MGRQDNEFRLGFDEFEMFRGDSSSQFNIWILILGRSPRLEKQIWKPCENLIGVMGMDSFSSTNI